MIEMYRQNILEHFESPSNFGEIKDATHIHKENNSSCGDSVEIFIKVEKDVIKDIKFNGSGCAISIASISMLTEKVKGMKIEDIMKIKEEEVINMLGIPISMARMKCAMLGLNGIKNTLNGDKNGNSKN